MQSRARPFLRLLNTSKPPGNLMGLPYNKACSSYRGHRVGGTMGLTHRVTTCQAQAAQSMAVHQAGDIPCALHFCPRLHTSSQGLQLSGMPATEPALHHGTEVHMLTCQEQAVPGAVLPQARVELAGAVLEAVPLVHNEVVPGDPAQQRHVVGAHEDLVRCQQHMAGEPACGTSASPTTHHGQAL